MTPVTIGQMDDREAKALTMPRDHNGILELAAAHRNDAILLDRALAILHRMATERTNLKRFLFRWYYADEPLRNDAANLVREAGFGMPMPLNTRLIGEQDK